MSGLTKILTGTALGAGLIASYNYFMRLRKAQAELEIVPKATLYQLSWDGIIIRVDVLMKNPTKGSFTIKFPFVKIIHKDVVLGSSQAVNKDIKIPAFGEAMIEKIMVQIPVVSLFSITYTVIKSLFNKETVKVTVKTMTSIALGLTDVPFENETELTIKE
jgi:hypothetical protein